MIDVPDYPFPVDEVGKPGGPQPEPSPHVVKSPYLARLVAGQLEWDAVLFRKPFQPLNAVGTNAQYNPVSLGQRHLGVSKLPGLDGSTVGKRPQEEIENYI